MGLCNTHLVVMHVATIDVSGYRFLAFVRLKYSIICYLCDSRAVPVLSERKAKLFWSDLCFWLSFQYINLTIKFWYLLFLFNSRAVWVLS